MSHTARRETGSDAGPPVLDEQVRAEDEAALDVIASRGPESLERLRSL